MPDGHRRWSKLHRPGEPAPRRPVRHCARCTAEIPPEVPVGVFVAVDGDGATSPLATFCAPCVNRALEAALRS